MVYKKKKKNNFYAYYLSSGEKGVLDNWPDCQRKVSGVSARYKGFVSKDEAEKWLAGGAVYKGNGSGKKKKKVVLDVDLKDGIYSDAGTGRGQGVEVRVTDKDGNSILGDFLGDEILNKWGNYNLGKKVTNNYGELLGLFFAIQIAKQKNVKKVFSDSELVLKYWSRGRYNKETGLADETVDMIGKLADLRREFELEGGKVSFVSGDVNPADLGFHR